MVIIYLIFIILLSIFNYQNVGYYIKNKSYKNGIFHAIDKYNIKKIDHILENNSKAINDIESIGISPIIYCLLKNRLDLIYKLLEYEPDLELENKNQCNIYKLKIKSKVKSKNEDIEAILYYKKRTQNSEYGFTILNYIILYDQENLYDNIKYNLNLLKINKKKQSYLIFACINNKKNFVEKIIKDIPRDCLNKYINLQDNNGLTALHWASKLNLNDIVQILLDNNADINIEDNNKEIALFNAIRSCDISLVEKFMLYKFKFNINHTNKYNNSLLILAAKKNLFNIVKLLIDNNININIVNNRGKNALSYAIKNNDFQIFKILVENGIRYNNSNNFCKNKLKNDLYKRIIFLSILLNRIFESICTIEKSLNSFDILNAIENYVYYESMLINYYIISDINFLLFILNNYDSYIHYKYLNSKLLKQFINSLKNNNLVSDLINKDKNLKTCLDNFYFKLIDDLEKAKPVFNNSNSDIYIL